MPESIIKAAKKAVEDIARPIGQVGTSISNEAKKVGDQFPDVGITPRAKPEPPAVLPPTRMPTSSDRQAARKKSIIDQLRRRGRASTILTDSGASDTLGG